MSEIVKITLNHTEFCAREVRGPQIVQTFSRRVNHLTEKFVALDKHSHTEYKYYLKKTVHVSSTFSRYLQTFIRQCERDVWKISLIYTEFCACQVCNPQIVQTFSLRVNLLTEKFLVSNEHSHIEYTYYFKRLCMFQVGLVDICRFF